MTSTIDPQTDVGAPTSPEPPAHDGTAARAGPGGTTAAERLRSAAFGLAISVVAAVGLVVVHAIRDDPEVTWGDVALRGALPIVVLPPIFAAFPRLFTGRASRLGVALDGGASPWARVGAVLLMAGALLGVLVRSYRRIG